MSRPCRRSLGRAWPNGRSTPRGDGRRGREIKFCIRRAALASRPTSSSIDESPSGDHRHEGGFPGDRSVESGSRLPDLDEDLLNRVFRFRGRGAGSSGQRPDQASESTHHFVDGAGFVPTDTFQDGRFFFHVFLNSGNPCGSSRRERTKCNGLPSGASRYFRLAPEVHG